MNRPEIEKKANFNSIKYSQVWEDSEILLEALNIGSRSNYLSIASAGDNTLAILSQSPSKVVALDLNINQLYLLELKVSAFKELKYQELLQFLGVLKSSSRVKTFKQFTLSEECKEYWNAHLTDISEGVIHIGKFERYFQLFGKKVIPLIHSKKTVMELLKPKSLEERTKFYNKKWNNLRWKLLFKLFFSKTFMGLKGREKAFFKHVEGDVSKTILEHTQYALTALDPSKNSYLHYILNANYKKELPYYLQEKNFLNIKNNLHKLEWHHQSIEEFMSNHQTLKFDGYNLSDIFEYMSEDAYKNLLNFLIEHSNNSARLVYWNMMVSRKSDATFQERLEPLNALALKLYKKDKTFFYRDFIVERVKK